MKKLIIINGSMGVGKTTVTSQLYKAYDRSIWLDGDWSWMMNPWRLTPKLEDMVFDNIGHTLKGFIHSDAFDYIFFCWVLHKKEWMDKLLNSLGPHDYTIQVITLTCSEAVLKSRLEKDERSEKVRAHALERRSLYENLETEKLSTNGLSIDDVVQKLITLIK